MILQIVNNSVTESNTLNIACHVHHRMEVFSYRKDIPSNTIPLGYISSEDIEANKNIVVVNYSDSISENSPEKTFKSNDFYIVTGTSFTTSYSDVLITDKCVFDSKGNTIPLFFGQKLMENTTAVNFEKVTNTKSEQINFGYLLSGDKTAVYYNFNNQYDPVTGLYELYYITTITSDNEITRSLINPTTAIREATWEDVDTETGELNTNVILYFKENNNNQTTYYFNDSLTFYVKIHENSYISPKRFASSLSEDGWFPVVRNGTFSHIGNNTNNFYSIVESSLASYVPYAPYLYDSYITYNFVTQSTLALSRGNLAINQTDRPLKIIIRDQDDNVLYALTTKDSVNGDAYSSTIAWNSSIINSWDNLSGIIELNLKIDNSWNLDINGYYEQKDYVYNEINLNPIYNTKVYSYYYVLYLKPDQTTRSLHHLLVRNDGIIVDTSDTEFCLLDEDGVYNANTIVGLTYRANEESYQLTDFYNLYTTNGLNTYNWFIIAEYYFSNNISDKDINLIDLDIYGNNLIDRGYVIKNTNLTQSSYLYGDFGLEYPKNNVLVYRLSYGLLEEYGGDFTLDFIKESLYIYLGASKYILLEWDEDIKDITIDNSNTGNMILSWNSVGYEYSYKIYRSFVKDAGFELIDTVSNSSAGIFSYTDITIDPNKIYYYYIVPVKNSIDFPQSITIGAVAR